MSNGTNGSNGNGGMKITVDRLINVCLVLAAIAGVWATTKINSDANLMKMAQDEEKIVRLEADIAKHDNRLDAAEKNAAACNLKLERIEGDVRWMARNMGKPDVPRGPEK